MHLDHHRPRASFPEQAQRYENLYLACPECNEVKGSTWPTAEESDGGLRFLDVCSEAASDHLRQRGEEVLPRGESPVGRFTIGVLDLNGPVHRERRRLAAEATAGLRDVKRVIREVRGETAGPARERLLRQLEKWQQRCEAAVGLAVPIDAPDECACGLVATRGGRPQGGRGGRRASRNG